ncbi:Phage protein (ACLAME 1104) [hydrothermal vent metagenome]|uniref:Phage protein (ACLAME 1104) n=1 Tax=hydrothermal vent metagenome TaxID=652676 RepID=A0A3B0UNC3_9ZZZZ
MKSKIAAYFLWFFLGFFSAHRFYLGKIGSGILYLLTGQLLGIGWIIDLFLIDGMVERYNLETRVSKIETIWV